MAADSLTSPHSAKPLSDQQLANKPLIDKQLLAQWQSWRQQLRHCGERRLFVLAGEQDWAMQQALMLTQSQPHSLWLGEHLNASSANLTFKPINKFKTLLGQEYQAVVFNAFSGLHPDALGALVGTLMAGGVLFLLCPPLERWSAYPDPDLVRYVAEPEQVPNVESGFLQRFVRLLHQDAQCLIWAQGANFPALPTLANTASLAVNGTIWQPKADRQGCLNNQQRHALAAILWSARRRQPLILTADRGRGKSSVLGLAAARLLKAGYKILLTAPSPNAVSQVLAHSPEPLAFMAPDAILAERPAVELLFIDEAAAIPVNLLLQLTRRYCCIFASTEHGYEGTGLGFQLKFQPQLLNMHPQTCKLHLATPARWSLTDPLEPLLFRLLALDAVAVTPANRGPLTIRWVGQAELLENETLLTQIFALLILAHYQTSPSDLRQLLDAPELNLAVMFRQSVPVAVALLIAEGLTDRYPLTPELSLAIWRGQRRPRGHLLPQSLAFHGGLSQACQFRYHRIMRIVVHPTCQQIGLGRQLLTWLQAPTQQQNLKSDFLGASFGASLELLHFWQASDFRAVRLGQSQDTVSGLQAVMMLWPSSSAAKNILPQWQAQFSANVCYSRQHLSNQPEQAALHQALTLASPASNPELDRHIAHDFAFYHRDLLCDQAALSRFVASQPTPADLSPKQRQLLAALLALDANPALVAKQWQLNGHKAALAQCRQLIQSFFSVPSET